MSEQDFINTIMEMYLNGASVYDICMYMDTGDGIVNGIIDRYSSLL